VTGKKGKNGKGRNEEIQSFFDVSFFHKKERKIE
jgi:hypothetical protein